LREKVLVLRFLLATPKAEDFHDFLKGTRILTKAASTSLSSLLTETKVHLLLSACPLRCTTSATTEELLEYVVNVEPGLEPGTRSSTATLCLPLHAFLA
jgi:hypothetical protein